MNSAVAVGVYVSVVLVLGLLARRRSSRSPEEYFLAGRGLGTLVLFMALFGTNATSFVLVGIPARAYTDGIAVFGLNAPIVALGIPLSFWAIGAPARRMAQRLGALSPAELYAKRFDSRAVGWTFFAFFTLYTTPYMVQAVKGAAEALYVDSEGGVPRWAGGLGVVLLSLVYTSLGGMRATAWTNVFQGGLFLFFMVAVFFLVSGELGGLGPAMEAVRAHDEALLVRGQSGLYSGGGWFSWGLTISLTVIAFPHMLTRLMAGRGDAELKSVSRLYPPALLLLWLPAVLLGVWGAAALPGLARPDQVMGSMSGAHLPGWMGPLAFLAVLAAVMSTLDAQLLTLSSMLVRDVLPAGGAASASGVRVGQGFALLVAAVVYLLAQVWGDSVFDISRKAFEGYTTLTPALLLGVRWKRFTAAGAIASILAGNAVLGLAWAGHWPRTELLPVFWALVVGSLAAVLVSWLTPPRPEATARAFGE